MPLPCPGLAHTTQLLTDVSTSIKQLEDTYLQRMRESKVVRDPLWTTVHVRGAHWGNHDSLIFELSDHTTCQCLIHHLGTLRRDTKVRAYAEISTTEQAACIGLQAAAHQAGVQSQLVGACMLLLPPSAGRMRGIQVQLDDICSPQIVAALHAWVARWPNGWY